ncbi:ABC transporter ATP-binding protein [Mycoplasmopsis columbinasalis]|uniref:ABC transporter ATP-binding protein n=1 Tax=Mycoplasmopsis columbinasalis TaxID=114880 RepID=A0A449BAG6_9BACT|nr:oligopeptide/dipeptide ABC transporter ATP-binding protein [Mycoplasmopsis columbinasalis]VEU78202.1 ABC transporter ATP-binding protein [Mycoplasmopsis columbinasalis]
MKLRFPNKDELKKKGKPLALSTNYLTDNDSSWSERPVNGDLEKLHKPVPFDKVFRPQTINVRANEWDLPPSAPVILSPDSSKQRLKPREAKTLYEFEQEQLYWQQVEADKIENPDWFKYRTYQQRAYDEELELLAAGKSLSERTVIKEHISQNAYDKALEGDFDSIYDDFEILDDEIAHLVSDQGEATLEEITHEQLEAQKRFEEEEIAKINDLLAVGSLPETLRKKLLDRKEILEFVLRLKVSKHLTGYNRKFRTPIIWDNKPEPLDLLVVKKDPTKTFWRRIVDRWSQKLKFFTRRKAAKKIIETFENSLTDTATGKVQLTNEQLDVISRNIDFNTFQKLIEATPKTTVLNKKTKVAARIENAWLTFKNPANPKEKNVVLRGASLTVYEGMVHAVIGESGSGKSVLTSLLYGLTGSNAVFESGSVKLYGLEVSKFSAYNWEKSKLRGRIVSAVFQNPMSILDPTMKVGKQIMEGLLINKIVKNKREAYEEAIKYLRLTKINNPEKIMKLYPHELSGGMIQRIAIASIVSLKPKILVLDEPTTALDPTVQAQVLNIIKELQEQFKIAIVFITHDLGVVSSISDFINIMYAGQIVESGTKEEILTNPQHPYTWGLITSMPDFNNDVRLQVIRGAVPSSLNQIKGDAFAVRNDYALWVDLEQNPPLYQVSPTHFVRSNLLNKQAPRYTPPATIQKLWRKYNLALNLLYNRNIFVEEEEYQAHQLDAQAYNADVSVLFEEHQKQVEFNALSKKEQKAIKVAQAQKDKSDKNADAKTPDDKKTKKLKAGLLKSKKAKAETAINPSSKHKLSKEDKKDVQAWLEQQDDAQKAQDQAKDNKSIAPKESAAKETVTKEPTTKEATQTPAPTKVEEPKPKVVKEKKKLKIPKMPKKAVPAAAKPQPTTETTKTNKKDTTTSRSKQ